MGRNVKTIAVDFDGTLCKDEFPGIGEPNNDLIDLLKNFQKAGVKLILWTLREDNEISGKILTQAVEWCESKGLHFDAVNENVMPEVQKTSWGWSPRKVAADMYIDDRSAFMHDGRLTTFRKYGEQ